MSTHSSPLRTCSKSPDTDKSKKYDRQLRLWGDHGQTALESTHICLINATATGTEILKSIVLAGVGAFTIIDGSKITGEDVGNNFFLDNCSIGKSRAEVATQLLLELNSDVRGDFVEESLIALLEANPSFFNTFSVVIATGIIENFLQSLSKVLWDAGIPLLVCRSYGMIGYMRIQFQEHTIIETHPENEIGDLRLDKPFPGLIEHAKSVDMISMKLKEHSHTPFLLILMDVLEDFKAENGGRIPKDYKEKQVYKEMIRNRMMKKESGIPEEEENFEEAIRAVNTALTTSTVPNEIKKLFTDPSCLNLTNETKPFWILTRALKEFVENEGQGLMPLRGTIPDMTSDTESYVKLQNVYRSQAKSDMEAIMSRVQHILSDLEKPQDIITEADVKLFCKNCHSLKVLRGRSIGEELDPKTSKTQEIAAELDNPDSEMIYYVILRAIERFFVSTNRYPGYFSDQVEPDIGKLKSCLNKILQEWGIGPLAKDDFIHEMCRYGASELHSVAAFMGGCAAQEVIKLVTGQYIPFDNTFIYNAITATSAVFQL